jgi:hypothetical protein
VRRGRNPARVVSKVACGAAGHSGGPGLGRSAERGRPSMRWEQASVWRAGGCGIVKGPRGDVLGGLRRCVRGDSQIKLILVRRTKTRAEWRAAVTRYPCPYLKGEVS